MSLLLRDQTRHAFIQLNPASHLSQREPSVPAGQLPLCLSKQQMPSVSLRCRQLPPPHALWLEGSEVFTLDHLRGWGEPRVPRPIPRGHIFPATSGELCGLSGAIAWCFGVRREPANKLLSFLSSCLDTQLCSLLLSPRSPRQPLLGSFSERTTHLEPGHDL